jgi:hypothetical protein
VCENYILHVKSDIVCRNRTLRLEINLVRVKMTLVRVVITFMPAEITLRVKISLRV